MNQINLVSKPVDYGVTNSYAMKNYVAIAPGKCGLDVPNAEYGKQKYIYKGNSNSGTQTVSIARRNARERNRVKQVNDSFNALRRRLPSEVIAALSGSARRGSGKKLSKVDTLRMVVEYIKHLQNLIEDSEGYKEDNKSPSFGSYENEVEECLLYGSSSPYSESVSSPVSSDSSAAASRVYSVDNCYSYDYQSVIDETISPMEDELFDAMSW